MPFPPKKSGGRDKPKPPVKKKPFGQKAGPKVDPKLSAALTGLKQGVPPPTPSGPPDLTGM